MRLLWAALLALIACGNAAAEPVTFRPVDVYVDAGERPLAAYQVEVVARGATVAGVEGGDAGAFAEPPHYDPAALQGGRIILAAFNTGTDLPRGRTRVATLHMRESGPAEYQIRLMAAASAAGQRVEATASVEPRKGD
jgi:hypothetical protein